ncbi:amidohydrolase family protein [Sphaerotilus mobilis]|uniref:Putative TIM-barrel fold metal-dependent hydrolase n=1 Tax=Sphaerotilus mobilis TaxID=47994 RepID=A0A4Q7LL90_9BURK|nr:amidohydrolase family protein [Sphaerotilus mobilis]RZS54943.1 putative TIM-barrel fold metal-dependent hydrolase [Sphaerotilus mobilis]
MSASTSRRRFHALLAGAALSPLGLLAHPARAAGAAMPLFDAHIHYSHDAVELLPPQQAVAMLRAAGLRGAFVSSSDDRGTQLLAAAAPDLIVPQLRPYRTRADVATWVREPLIVDYVEQRLARHRYVGLGEFHLYGEEAALPVPRRLVALAREHGLILHAHSDIDAVERLFALWPEARVLWAHSGFERPESVRAMLRRHPRLWCDLAFRGDHADGDRIEPAWREAFDEFSTRFVIGTDTFTPERWHVIGDHAERSRRWLASLRPAQAEAIGWRNAESLLRGVA